MVSKVSRKTWLIVAIAIVGVAAAVGIALSRDSASPSDDTLPIITWNETSLSDLQGTPLVLNFWSISCGWCRYQLPFLEAVAQQNSVEVRVVAINIRDSSSGIREFFRNYKPAMTIAIDGNGAAFRKYCAAYNNTSLAIPFTLFVDSEGLVRDKRIGAFASEEALWNTLHQVLGVPTP